MIRAEVVGAKKVIDKLQGQFAKGKRKPKLSVGYSAPYAMHVHENLAVKPSNGERKFLEKPLREMEQQLRDITETEVRRSRNLERAMRLAGERLLEESQKLVPVVTGQLRDSGYVRVD